MAEDRECPACNRRVSRGRWQTGALASVLIGLAGFFFQAHKIAIDELAEHKNLPWHAGAGELHAKTRAELQALHVTTEDRFRRREWEAWRLGNDRIISDMQRRIGILETKQ